MKLIIIVPCYNEAEVLPFCTEKLYEVLTDLISNHKLSPNSSICFVDDGSSDDTWKLITDYTTKHKGILGIKLAQNAGHQATLLAGLTHYVNDFDCFITIDADLQDDPSVIYKFIEEFRNGKDIVYGVRSDRRKDSFFKRSTAQLFYKVMISLGVNLVYNHADYRLASQKVIKNLLKFQEYNLFLRAIFPLLSTNQSSVYYKRDERTAGVTKYPLSKMINFALNGITSFSITPLRLISLIGLLFCILSLLLFVWILYGWMTGSTVLGWSSVMTLILFIGGIQIISIGIVAEYIGKIYLESKNRPKFLFDSTIE